MRKSLIVSTVFASALLLPACGDPKPPEAAANGTEEIVAPSEIQTWRLIRAITLPELSRRVPDQTADP
jgi:hypothetical protein